MIKLMESQIPQNFATGLYNDKSYDLSGQHTEMMADIIFTGVSNALGAIKTKEQPVAFIFKKNNDEFICGAVIKFIPNDDDPTKAGSWSYVWTFDKEDIPANAKLIGCEDANIIAYFRGVARNKYGAAFRDQAAITECTRYLMQTISKWLDENASDQEEVGVELEGVFQATVAVENGIKYKALVPEGEIKKLIKDDSAIEV